ncbi:hypothetical protein DPMN_103068 [Dreissena polymorpha]|uniref:Reverse transcriptase domain-containing protein n=1 Tax=Dreissena polymorpha TaxID=45954 RepID=A0A9D4H5G6_DREPO|nr:hypothetical protein DPMN_103068 [Dreissena polymorpha]
MREKVLGRNPDSRQALDKNHYAAAIIMDLSKAFDCLPHDKLLQNCQHMVCQSLHPDSSSRTFLTENSKLK